MKKLLAVLSLFAITANANATLVNSDLDNLVVNGSFELDLANPLATYGRNAFATAWSAGDSGGLMNGPDIINGDHNFGLSFASLGDTYRNFAAAPTGQEQTWAAPNSSDGGSWLALGRSASQWDSVMQTVDGFVTGQRYRVSWDEANFGYVDTATPSASYDDDNFFSFMLDNTTHNADTLSVAQTWSPNSFEFVSDRTGSYDLTIRLGSTNQSYLSMDGLTVKAVNNVPEPKTWLMLLAGLLLIMPRRVEPKTVKIIANKSR